MAIHVSTFSATKLVVFVNAYWRFRMERWEFVHEHWRKWPEARVAALAL